MEAAVPASPADAYDYVVIATKAIPAISAAIIADLPPILAPGGGRTAIVVVQNGLEPEAPFAAALPGVPILSGVSMIGSTRTGPAAVRHEMRDRIFVGAYRGSSADPTTADAANAAARDYAWLYDAGLTAARTRHGTNPGAAVAVRSIAAVRWRKLLYNASFNPLCAVLRVGGGVLVADPARKNLTAPASYEIAAIAAADGFGPGAELAGEKIGLSPEDVEEVLSWTTPDNMYRPSMLVDLEAGRPMELEAIFGAPLRVARARGVKTPVLDVVYQMLRVLQWTLEGGPR